MNQRTDASGMRTFFVVVWLGQVVSVVGSGLTSFALGVWVFERTGSVTQFALLGLFAVLPRVLLSPLAGAIADRWDRRVVMIVADAGAGVCTLILALLLYTNKLEMWHMFLVVFSSAAFSTLQWPAYSATTTILVPKKDLGRANGVVQFGQAASDILAPVLAGALLLSVQLEGVILIDFATFLFAIVTLAGVRFPQPQSVAAAAPETSSIRQDLTLGWRYITARQGLLGLLFFLTVVNFIWGMVGALIAPMVLGFASSNTLGLIISVASAGMLVGGVAMSIWGGPQRRIDGVLGFEFLSGTCFLLLGLRPSFWTTALGAFGAHATIAVVLGSNQAIWQSKVAPGIQGRVFATQQMIGRAAAPLAYLLAGPLAENVFEPLLARSGSPKASVGSILGTGPGRGIGLLFIVMGLVKMGLTLAAYARPRIRLVEDELPDAVCAVLDAPSL